MSVTEEVGVEKQDAAPAYELIPIGQGLQLAEPGFAYWPAGQIIQTIAPALE